MKNSVHGIVSSCPEDTIHIGTVMGRRLRNGSVVALKGELGSGKTCLTQGIALGLEVPEGSYVTSPSYTLINEYPGRLRLVHVDLYRLQDEAELADIGLTEIIGTDGVTVIEWADRLAGYLPDERLSVSISIVNDHTRTLQLTGYGLVATRLAEYCMKEFPWL